MNDKIKESINALFYPKNIVIYEASNKLWYFNLGLVHMNYNKEKLYLINPKEETVFDLKTYKSIDDVPEDTIDLLMLSVGKHRLKESLLKLLSKKSIKAIHIFTAGTAEFDEEGSVIEKEIYNLLKKNGTYSRAIGPNCMGVYSTKGHIAYEPLFPIEPGNISLVYQSGDLHSQTIRIGARRNNLKFSKGVSIGNCVDLQISDFLEYYNSDDDTDIILVYYEGINSLHPEEGKKLFKTLKMMKKPVLFMNGGMTKRAQKAVLTHTGSISTNLNIWKGIFKQTPVIHVPTSLDNMLDYAYLFNDVIKRYKKANMEVKYPEGKSVLTVLWSGGFGILATNTLIELGLDVPYFQGETLEKLRKVYPIKIGSLSNPLDIPWVTNSQKYVEVVKAAISENINLVMILTDAFEDIEGNENFERYYNNLKKIKEHTELLNKILILILPEYPTGRRKRYNTKLMNDGFIVYPSIERAAKAYLALYEYGRKIRALRKN